MIRPMTANTENLKARDAIKRKSFGNAGNRNRQTHCRGTLIDWTEVIMKARYEIRRRYIVKRTLSNYAKVKGKVAGDSV